MKTWYARAHYWESEEDKKITADDAQEAAESFVERCFASLDWPTEINVFVFDENKENKKVFNVIVESLPVFSAKDITDDVIEIDFLKSL